MKPPQYVPPCTNSAESITTSGNQSMIMGGDDGMGSEDMSCSNSGNAPEVKKLQKRAANRRSAQLSRKRKKQFMEELKEENDDLRRKEQILLSIPDLIVVFNSSGKLGFVSRSVSNFLEFTPHELEGQSFWERLCEGSVRLLKAAFMDALAAKTSESDTTPLGSGVWELKLKDKNGNFVLVTLNGVVHFSGDAPECVCSIRPMQPEEKSGTINASTSVNTETIPEPLMKRNKYVTMQREQSVVKESFQKVVSDVESGTSVTFSD
eukprot:scaffold435_cov275-Chaetoceros_neogracile.AAC.14